MKRRVYVTKIFNDIAIAHKLPEHKGKCARYHGHNYRLEVTVSRKINTFELAKLEDAMVCDFTNLKDVVNEFIIESLDHQDVSSKYKYSTAEIMCVDIFNQLDTHFNSILAHNEIRLESIRLYETSTSYAECKREVSTNE